MDADQISKFLELEKKWLDLRNSASEDDPDADCKLNDLADAMDIVWFKMTAEEKLQINSRW